MRIHSGLLANFACQFLFGGISCSYFQPPFPARFSLVSRPLDDLVLDIWISVKISTQITERQGTAMY